MMYRKWVKRLLDILLSGAALVVLCIPMGVIALWIKLDSPGPVLFRQKRVGKNKVLFDILKFRTMRTPMPLSPKAGTSCGKPAWTSCPSCGTSLWGR